MYGGFDARRDLGHTVAVDRIRTIFVLPSLTPGGAERVMLTLATHLDRDRFEPVLAVGEARGALAADVPSDVTVRELGGARVRRAVPGLVRLVRAERPGVVFSTLGYLNVLVALARPFMPRATAFVGRETNIPSHHLARCAWPRLLPFMYRTLYRRFDRVVCQSRDMLRDMVDHYALPEARARVIHNPVDVDEVLRRAKEGGHALPEGKVNLLAAGKFMPQKGFDILLRAMARSADPDLHLTILGQGPERDALLALRDELGLAGRVDMPGFAGNPYAWMRAADLFVLSSRFEGFPNVVLEAQACGTPVLAFGCPGGLDEIMREGVNGWLVPPGDEAALAAALPTRARAGLDPGAVRATVAERYGVGHITALYEQLFLDALHRRKGGRP